MARWFSAVHRLLPFALGVLVGFAGLAVFETVHARRGTPDILLILPFNGATVAGTVGLWAEATDAGFAGVRFQVNGADLGSEITEGACTRDWDTSKMADGSYSLMAIARDDSGLQVTSPASVVTVANAAPQIFDVKAWNIGDTGASITWYTLQPAYGEVDFGPTPYYGTRTPFLYDATTSHTQVLSGLASGTSYHFRVYAQNLVGRRTASADLVFTTTGPPPTLVQSPVKSGLAALASQAASVAKAIATPLKISYVTASTTRTTARITWITDQPANSELRYGNGRFTGGFVVKDAALLQLHSVLLADLKPGTTYLYQVQSRTRQGRTASSVTFRFTTSK